MTGLSRAGRRGVPIAGDCTPPSARVFCWCTRVSEPQGAAVKHLPVCIVLVFSPLMLAAQNEMQSQLKTQSPIVIDLGTLPGNDCPVGMSASQGVWDHTLKVRQGQREQSTQPFGQRIFLTLTDSHPAPIVAATVKVRGLTGKNRVLQTVAEPNADRDPIKIIKITFTANSRGSVSGDLYAPGFTSVTSIELLDVSYDDGKIWKIGGSSGCRVKPDPMMLIAHH